MSLPTVDLRAFVQAWALMNLLMAGVLWSLQRPSHDTPPARLWSLGLVGLGLCLGLISLRPLLPYALGYGLVSLLGMGAFVLRVQALRLEMGRPLRRVHALLLWLVPVMLHHLMHQVATERVAVAFGHLCWALGVGAVGWHAWQLGLRPGFRSARMIGVLEGAFTLSILIRAAALLGDRGSELPALTTAHHLDVALGMLIGFVANLYGSLAYLSMTLDKSSLAQQQALLQQALERNAREAAERQAADLQQLLAERSRLLRERERLLRVLAHEVRQPLHNTNGVLAAAQRALQAVTHPAAENAQLRLQRAQTVLEDLRSVLDNTLTAAALLNHPGPLVRQELEIDWLIELVRGDLEPPLRERVTVRWCTPLHTLEAEPGLLRVALRNLLRNAFVHGGAQTQVVVRIEEQSTPPGLVLVVEDDGVGSRSVLAPPAPGDEDGDWPAGPHGLGLHIVRKVMALHGGQLQLSAVQPSGLQARLVFPDLVDG